MKTYLVCQGSSLILVEADYWTRQGSLVIFYEHGVKATKMLKDGGTETRQSSSSKLAEFTPDWFGIDDALTVVEEVEE